MYPGSGSLPTLLSLQPTAALSLSSFQFLSDSLSFFIFPFSFVLSLTCALINNSLPAFRIFSFLLYAYLYSLSWVNTFTSWSFSQTFYSLILHQKGAKWSWERIFFSRWESLQRLLSVAAFALLGPLNGCLSTSKHPSPDCPLLTYKYSSLLLWHLLFPSGQKPLCHMLYVIYLYF